MHLHLFTIMSVVFVVSGAGMDQLREQRKSELDIKNKTKNTRLMRYSKTAKVFCCSSKCVSFIDRSGQAEFK